MTTKATLKERIKEISDKKQQQPKNLFGEYSYAKNCEIIVAEKAMEIIKELQEIIEMQRKALEIIGSNEYFYNLSKRSLSEEDVSEESIVKAMSQYAKEVLNKIGE